MNEIRAARHKSKRGCVGLKRHRGAAVLVMAFLCAMPKGLLTEQKELHEEQGPVFSERVTSLMGIYEAVPPAAKIVGEKQAEPPSLNRLGLKPAAAKLRAETARGEDPKDLCQVLGPFRLMARAGVKFEILRDAPNKIIMLFDNRSWGNVRNLRLDAEFLPVTPGFRPLWNGDSIARWEGDTLVVDSIHFTNKTWLNETGVTNSRQLRLTERFRLTGGGKYLAYQATAVDPDVLAVPVSYTRYFKRTTRAIVESNCFDQKRKPASARP